MYKILGMTAIAALLAGCADEVAEVIVPTDEEISVCSDPDDSETCIAIPASGGVVTIGGLEAASYNGTTLRVQIALDGPNALQTYEMVDDPRPDDYQKYTFAASERNRAYTALAGRSSGGEVTAVVAMDSGQFNRFFAGATVIQDQEAFSRPTAGTASYLGDYVGLIKIGTETEPSEVRGLVFLNANFADNKVEGEMTDRVVVVGSAELDDLIFVNSDIKSDGIFGGGIELDDNSPIGAYGGAFGGSSAGFVGGTVNVSGDLGGGLTGDEFGIFVIETCGAVGTDCFPD